MNKLLIINSERLFAPGKKIQDYSLLSMWASFCLLAFFLPIYSFLSSLATIIISIIWLINIVLSGYSNLSGKHWRTMLIFSVFYLVHFVGLLISNNIEAAFNDLETKLSLIIFPIIVLSLKSQRIGTDLFPSVSLIFIISLFFMMLVRLFFSIHLCLVRESFDYLYYNRLSGSLHPSYFSMYIISGCSFLLLDFVPKSISINRFFWLFRSGFFLLSGIFVFLLSSRAGIASLFIMSLLTIIHYRADPLLLKKCLLNLTLLILVPLIVTSLFAPMFINRIAQARQAITSTSINEDQMKESSFQRVAILKVSLNLASQVWLYGVGNGDAQEELNKAYRVNKLDYYAMRQYNPHNQFIQSLISLGILGLLTLVLMLTYPVFLKSQKTSFLYLQFLLIVSFNLLFESMLERQAGVMFYAFFNTLLFSDLQHSKARRIAPDSTI